MTAWPIDDAADPEVIQPFEASLPPCGVCGGAFAYKNSMRCPHCAEPYLNYDLHYDSLPVARSGDGEAQGPGRVGELYWCELHAGPRAQLLTRGEWNDVSADTAWRPGY